MSDEDQLSEIDFGAISEAIEGLQAAVDQGLAAIGAAEEAAGDFDPSHEIIIEVDLSANVDGHPYRVDAALRYQADLTSLLATNVPQGGLGALLGGLGVDLDADETGAVLDQLRKPRGIGVLADVDLREHELHGDGGPVDAAPETGSTMQITADHGVLRFSFSRAFSYPELQALETVYCVTPSDEAMQEHVAMPIDRIGEVIEFSWTEEGKDGLTLKGTVIVREL